MTIKTDTSPTFVTVSLTDVDFKPGGVIPINLPENKAFVFQSLVTHSRALTGAAAAVGYSLKTAGASPKTLVAHTELAGITAGGSTGTLPADVNIPVIGEGIDIEFTFAASGATTDRRDVHIVFLAVN